jgi:hypothetical protein
MTLLPLLVAMLTANPERMNPPTLVAMPGQDGASIIPAATPVTVPVIFTAGTFCELGIAIRTFQTRSVSTARA